jgi:hypothetical protein
MRREPGLSRSPATIEREAIILTEKRYAVLFKTFTIDNFVKRRLARIVAAAPSGDVYLMIDETNGAAGRVDFDRVIRYQEADVVRLGFPDISQGSLFWYNADYPLYWFQHLRPDYDVIVTVEYDAVPTVDLDTVVREFRAEKLDFVGHAIAKTVDAYWWSGTMLRFYERSQIRPYQICAGIFSNRSVQHLAASRLRHGAAGVSDAREWPIGETFVGTELALAGFRLRDLSSFGKLARYDWWPPIHERELPYCGGEVFVHPVLTGRRYLKSLFKSNFRSGLIVSAKLVSATIARASQRWYQSDTLTDTLTVGAARSAAPDRSLESQV